MADSSIRPAEGPTGPARGFSPRTLWLASVLATLATLALVFVVFHVLGLVPWSMTSVQRGTVK